MDNFLDGGKTVRGMEVLRMVSVFFRTLLIYIFLLAAMRLMGKRQIGELQISELIVTFMLSELAVNPIANPSMPLMHAVIPILQLLSTELILSFWMTKSNRMKRLLTGSPAMLICRGKLDQKVMAENRLEVDELLSEMRQSGIVSLEDVEYAILEENGKISLFPKAGRGALTYNEMQNGTQKNGIAHSIIIDGEIRTEQLAVAGKDEKWLKKVLKKERVCLAGVFLMTVDDEGEIYLIRKER